MKSLQLARQDARGNSPFIVDRQHEQVRDASGAADGLPAGATHAVSMSCRQTWCLTVRPLGEDCAPTRPRGESAPAGGGKPHNNEPPSRSRRPGLKKILFY